MFVMLGMCVWVYLSVCPEVFGQKTKPQFVRFTSLFLTAARCYASTALAVVRCLCVSVCLPVMSVHSVKTSTHYSYPQTFFHRRVAKPF